MKMFKYLLLLILISCFHHLTAQNYFDILKVGDILFPVNFSENSNKKIRHDQSYIDAKLPILLKKDAMQFGFSFHSYKFKGISDTDLNNRYYISFIEIGYLKTWSEKFQMRMAIYPKLSSDFKNINGNDFMLPALCILQWKKHEKLKYGFGMYYSREFFGHYFSPIIYIDWQMTDRWKMKGDMPSNFQLSYLVNEKIMTGLYLKSSSTSIRVYNNSKDYYLTKSHGDISIFADFYLTKSLVAQIKTGISLERSFELFEDDDKIAFAISAYKYKDNRTPLNDDLKPAIFAELNFIYRYRL